MKKSLILLMLLVVNVVLRANGDPVAERSALTLARMPVAVHVPEVQLLDERCRFTLHATRTDVEVRYLLHNRSQQDFRSLPYGFPVDWFGEGRVHWESRDIWSESLIERGWRDSYVQDVMFSLDGHSLPWQCSADTVLRPRAAVCDTDFITEVRWHIDSGLWTRDPLLAPDDGPRHYSAARAQQIIAKYGDSILYYDPALCRRWYYVRLDIPAGGTVELTVRYSIENHTYNGLSDAMTLFEAKHYVCGEFQYDFSPAAYWGDGHAQRMNVVLDTADIRHYWQSVSVEGLAMRRQGRGFAFEGRDVDLAAAEPLKVHYCTDRGFSESLSGLLSRRIDPGRYTVAVSGADPKYPKENLSDLDLGTATVLRADGDDSIYVRITFPDSVFVTGVLLYNGYCKDRAAWRNNSRIDTLHCHLATRVWDQPGEEVIQLYYAEGDYKRWLQGHEPEDFSWQGLTDAAIKVPVAEPGMEYDFPWSYDDTRQKVKELTLCVTAARKGRRYDDLCVSEIIILGD